MAKRPAPPATRVELEETIAQIRAKKADGYLIDEYWTAEQAPQPKTRTLLWGILRVALGKDGSDLVRNGQRVVLKGS
jgi:hypothetical protein